MAKKDLVKVLLLVLLKAVAAVAKDCGFTHSRKVIEPEKAAFIEENRKKTARRRAHIIVQKAPENRSFFVSGSCFFRSLKMTDPAINETSPEIIAKINDLLYSIWYNDLFSSTWTF